MNGIDNNRRRESKRTAARRLSSYQPESITGDWRAQLIKSNSGRQLPVVTNALITLRWISRRRFSSPCWRKLRLPRATPTSPEQP